MTSDLWRYFTDVTVIATALAVVFTLGQLFTFYRRSLRDLTVAYRIAIIGLPRSGKTALIGAMFNHMFSFDLGGTFMPAGQETINRVNRVIATLEGRRPLPPTREKDVFIFRFIYKLHRSLFLRGIRYEGEIVDFPGELSEQLLESAADGTLDDDIGLFHKEYYSWMISSKAHIFVIDLAQFLMASPREDYIARVSSEIRAAWQTLNEEVAQSIRAPGSRVAIVFSKSDLLSIFSLEEVHGENETVQKLAYAEPPESYQLIGRNVEEKSREGQKMVELYFDSLLRYFMRQQCVFEFFFVSSYQFIGANRIGVQELVKFVIPTREHNS